MLTSSAKPIAKKGLESTASCYFFLEENSVVHYSHIMMIKNQPPLQHFFMFLLYLHTDPYTNTTPLADEDVLNTIEAVM